MRETETERDRRTDRQTETETERDRDRDRLAGWGWGCDSVRGQLDHMFSHHVALPNIHTHTHTHTHTHIATKQTATCRASIIILFVSLFPIPDKQIKIQHATVHLYMCYFPSLDKQPNIDYFAQSLPTAEQTGQTAT